MNEMELDTIMRPQVRFALSHHAWGALLYKARMVAYGVGDMRLDPALARASSKLWYAFMAERHE